MTFHFRDLFRKPAHTEVAELRDELEATKLHLDLLETIVQQKSRPRRERRKDASDIKHAIAARAAAYSERFAKLDDSKRDAFIAAAKNGGRG